MRIKLITALLTSLVLVSGLPGPASADTAGSEREVPTYKNLNSGLCISVAGASTANGAKLIQWTCQGEGRGWEGGGAWKQIVNFHSRQCMAIPGGSTSDGVQAIQWPCGSGQEQFWNDDGVEALKYGTIVNYKSRLCLAVSGGSTALGAAVIQWPCNGRAEQQWKRGLSSGE